MFDGRLPAKYRDAAPRVETTGKGDDVWVFNGAQIPNIGLNAVAGRPKEEYGIDPTSFDEMQLLVIELFWAPVAGSLSPRLVRCRP